jgi:beta-lactamase regulating signal transducer with metallopeptidase domain
MLGCFGLFALWLKRSRLFRARLAGKKKPATTKEIELLKQAQVRIGITSQVNLIFSDAVAEPVVWGVWKPTILMPPGLSKKLTEAEFESILIHELIHVANKDNLIYILQTTLCCLLWFHPLVWLVKRRILEERERVCDETVIQHGSESSIYATGLLKVVRFGLQLQESPV